MDDFNKCCETVSHHYADISLPVELSPHASVGKIETECCGKPIIRCKEARRHNTCEITITQKIQIKIPIKYGAKICPGKPEISCHQAPEQ